MQICIWKQRISGFWVIMSYAFPNMSLIIGRRKGLLNLCRVLKSLIFAAFKRCLGAFFRKTGNNFWHLLWKPAFSIKFKTKHQAHLILTLEMEELWYYQDFRLWHQDSNHTHTVKRYTVSFTEDAFTQRYKLLKQNLSMFLILIFVQVFGNQLIQAHKSTLMD